MIAKRGIGPGSRPSQVLQLDEARRGRPHAAQHVSTDHIACVIELHPGAWLVPQAPQAVHHWPLAAIATWGMAWDVAFTSFYRVPMQFGMGMMSVFARPMQVPPRRWRELPQRGV
ncbi:MAG: hypothetical protein KF778_12785 [Rhodocyclaceae bacterium]|nr:hypothetical protein [Rhodocyclaceae bacterium]MBX3669268.1 hypothetical protein [Rhodocyclaceae bacterium]